ncbi:hypothetical protein THAOC_06185, partial [Thalassiosira oceanica]
RSWEGWRKARRKSEGRPAELPREAEDTHAETDRGKARANLGTWAAGATEGRGRRRRKRSEESRESRALTAPSQRHELIMASESASPDDYMDMDTTDDRSLPGPN